MNISFLSLQRKETKETVYQFLLVGPSGLEPPTSCLSGTRSNLLSYDPMWLVSDFRFTWMVEMMGFDSRANYALGLPRSRTSTGSSLCTVSPSNPLRLVTDFSNIYYLVEMMGFEPMTPCLQGRCSPS